MTGRVALVAAGLLIGAQSHAQDVGDTARTFAERLEVSGFLGYTLNNDVEFDANDGLAHSDVNFYDSIGPNDRFSYGASIAYEVTPNLQVGVLWSRFSGPLEVRDFDPSAALTAGWPGAGTGATGAGGRGALFPVLVTTNGQPTYRIGDMSVNNYHATLQWNFLEPDAQIRPFVFGGLGMTSFGDVDYQFVDTMGATTGLLTQRVSGDSRFSTTWGVGVRAALARGLGLRLSGRWTPTRLSGGEFTRAATTTATGAEGATLAGGTNDGWWCDAYWGCFANNAATSNQFSFTAGLSYRF